MKRQTVVIAALGTFVVLVAWYLLLWGPKGHQLDAAKADKAAAEQLSSDATLKLARLTATEARKDELLASNARFLTAVPEKSDVAGIIVAINDAASGAGISFLSITPNQPTAPLVAGAPSNVPLALLVKGGYAPVLDFLDRLSSLNRFVTVDGITFTPEVEGTTVKSVSVSLTARAFTTELPTTAVAKGTPTAGTTAPAAPAATTGAAK